MHLCSQLDCHAAAVNKQSTSRVEADWVTAPRPTCRLPLMARSCGCSHGVLRPPSPARAGACVLSLYSRVSGLRSCSGSANEGQCCFSSQWCMCRILPSSRVGRWADSLPTSILPAAAKAGLEYLVRVAFGTALIASVCAVYIAIAAIASGSSDRDDRQRGGGGYYSGPRVFFDLTDLLWYW